VAGLDGQAVHAIFRADDGSLWFGADSGALARGPDGAIAPTALQGTPVYAIDQDETGGLYFGTELGAFRSRTDGRVWFWYESEKLTEQGTDWQPFMPERSGDERNFPTADRVSLPPVRCLRRGPDSSLWLGTERGVARYVAREAGEIGDEAAAGGPEGGATGTYTTLLEAFPELTSGRVYAIETDERGLVWFATDRGLFRHDGRDWWQHRGAAWAQLGRGDRLLDDVPEPPARGFWRFDRAASRWQRSGSAQAPTWADVLDPPTSTAEGAVRALAWTDGVVAEVGSWDGTRLADVAPVAAARLVMRHKPSEERIVDGGIPAVPRLPVGDSVWRYLSREPAPVDLPGTRPAWTIEGRLLPPPDRAAAPPGRYDLDAPPPPSAAFDGAVFAFLPAAGVRFAWAVRRPGTVLVRLKTRQTGEVVEPAILDRVWQGIQQVRPAGVRVRLAVDEATVRGK
jgi:hypothetical protein